MPEKYRCTLDFTKEMIVNDFIRLSDDWFVEESNGFFGKRDTCLKYLMFWAESGEFGPDYDEYYLIYLKNKFLEYFEGCYEQIQTKL